MTCPRCSHNLRRIPGDPEVGWCIVHGEMYIGPPPLDLPTYAYRDRLVGKKPLPLVHVTVKSKGPRATEFSRGQHLGRSKPTKVY